MPELQPPTQPLGSPDPSGLGVPPPPPSQVQVIQPDNPPVAPHKQGSWDDILPQKEPGPEYAAEDGETIGNPADNQPLPAKLHDLSTTLRGQPDDMPNSVSTDSGTNIFEPAAAQSDEPHGMFDALDQPEPPSPPVIKRDTDTQEAPGATVETQQPTDSEQSSEAPTQSYQMPSSGSDGDVFEQELEDTFAARFARYGKTAVTALALPFVSSGRLTKNILRNGLRTSAPATPQQELPDFAQPTEPDQAKRPVYVPPATAHGGQEVGSAISQVSSRYGISRHEALEKIRQAVTLANQQAGHEVARILDHDPTIETDDEVGVYIDVEGGRALSLNGDDVMRILGRYL